MNDASGQQQQSGEGRAAGPARERKYGRPLDRPLIPAGGGIPAIFRMIALFCMIIIGVVGWFLMREKAPPADLYLGPASEVGTASIVVRLGDETDVLAHEGGGLTVFRFASNRQILILSFGSLREQGLMLNRIAAFVEKAGLPRDRVLRDDELEAAISAAGDTMETYYFGHDYAAADLARFFMVADRDGVRLRPQEEWLRQLLRQETFFDVTSRRALISIPGAGVGPRVDAVMRASILRHELSHGEFFANRNYAEYVRSFWRDELRDEGRAAFRRFLAGQGYDSSNEDLMANEMQAYLMHTSDPRLFAAELLGVGSEQIGRWQAGFLLGMPNGWLRDACVAALPSAGAVMRRPRRRPRGRLASPRPGLSRRSGGKASRRALGLAG